MPKPPKPRRARRAKAPTFFVVASAHAEAGTGIDDDGHPSIPVVRVNLVGRWTHGQAQTIPVLMERDLAIELGDLVSRVAIKARDAETDPDADALATP